MKIFVKGTDAHTDVAVFAVTTTANIVWNLYYSPVRYLIGCDRDDGNRTKVIRLSVMVKLGFVACLFIAGVGYYQLSR